MRLPLRLTTVFVPFFVFAFVAACEEPSPPSQGPPNGPSVDAGANQLCNDNTPCPEGQECVAGICQMPVVQTDGGGPEDAAHIPRARIEICTIDGCLPPHRLDFGGSRLGLSTLRNLRVKSVGDKPLTLRSIDILNTGTEFGTEPHGQLELVLQPGEEISIRVSHTASDGFPDIESLQIISDAERARVLVELHTEYKGLPALTVSEMAASNADPIQVLDFGQIRLGETAVKTIYIKNRDAIRNGSVLSVSELRVDPQSSTNFVVSPDRNLPFHLNQFSSLCMGNSNCMDRADDYCDTSLGVCAEADGRLVDITTATVTFIGQNTGLVQESLLLSSNDEGQDPAQTLSINLRANVVYSQLEVSPDPISFPEAYIGFEYRQTITFSNFGTSAVTINRLSLRPLGHFRIDIDPSTLPWQINPQETRQFDLVYRPLAVQNESSTLLIESNDSLVPMPQIRITARALQPPVIEVSHHYANFLDVHQGNIKTIVVDVHNRGGSELRVASLSLSATTSASFTVDPVSLTPIAPGASQSFNLRFAPSGTSYPAGEGGVVLVQSNDPNTPSQSVGLFGRGINPEIRLFPVPPFNFNLSPQNGNNPNIYEGQTVDLTTTISNPGIGPLTVSGLQIQGDTRGYFRLINPPALPFVVNGNQGVNLTLRYSPVASGNDVAELHLQSNDADVGMRSGILISALAGSAINCPIRPNTSAYANPAGQCEYQCLMNYYDLDQNMGNGCEYNCVLISNTDRPDDAFIDANCDGIDGIAQEAVFVAPPPLGNDSNSGNMAAPKASIANALQSTSAFRSAIYIAQGTYSESLILVDGVSMYGAYDASDGWSRAVDHTTTILGQSGATIAATTISQSTIIDRLTIVASSPSSRGISSIAVNILNSGAGFEIRNCVIIAGDGSRGNDGTRGSNGSSGGNASGGGNGCDGCSSGGGGGGGGGSSCGANGGNGGGGGYDNSNGGGGGRGASNGGYGGGGGAGARVCDSGGCSSCAGRKGGGNGGGGAFGGDGANGSSGNRGSAGGSISAGKWIGGQGGSGANGGNGGGGGGAGGGGGGADDCYARVPLFGCRSAGNPCERDRGGGGGGGGAGACPGQGGNGGEGGGGSFGVFLRNSNIIMANNRMTAGTGGRGGNGAEGGSGGTGGAGANGGGGRDDSGDGARGGDGGDGGNGGRGGGGGGGVSYCVYRSNSSGVALSNNVCVSGTGGAGGSGGQSGYTGNAGTVY